MNETIKDKNDNKKKNKNRKLVILVTILVFFLCIGLLTYNLNAEKKKDEAQKAAFDNVVVEVKDDYTETIPLTSEEKILKTKDLVNVLKGGKEDKDTKITKVSKESIDTSKEGGYTISYTVETLDSLGNKATKEYKKTFTVTNTDKVAPVIKLKKETVEIIEGDTYEPTDNIKSVKDDFDGDITKVDSKPTETGTAYYLIDSSKLDTSKAGEYKVKVTAVDKAGNESTKEFTVKVNAKKEDKETNSSSSNSSTSNKNNSTSNSNKGNSSSSTNSSSSSSQTSSNNNNTSTNSTPQQTCTTVWVQDTDAYDETVVEQAAWDETVSVKTGTQYICHCGQIFNSYNDWLYHSGQMEAIGDQGPDGKGHGYTAKDTYTNSTIHHDAITHVVHHEATGHNEQRCS